MKEYSVLKGETMNWRKAPEIILNRLSLIATVGAIIAFVIPLLTPPTDQDSTGGAGLFAPVVALCVAAMILAEALIAGRLQFRRLPSIFIGLGSMGSAYLWMAAENNSHPLAPELPLALAILFAMAAIFTLLASLNSWSNSRSSGQSSSD